MDVSERIRHMQALDLFQDLSEEKHREFIGALAEKQLNPGDILFRDGDPADSLYVLVKGALSVTKNNRPITQVEPVDYIGEMALLEDLPRSATVTAVKPSVLLVVSRPLFERYLQGHPVSQLSITRSLCRKIRRDTEMIARDCERANILLHDMKNRLTPFMYLDLLVEPLSGGPHAKFIHMMRECRRHLLAMTEEAMALIKKQKRAYTLESASLLGLVCDVVENELPEHPDLDGKTMRVVSVREIPEFLFHQFDIRRVLTNLILNAAQASMAGGDIEVEVDHGEKEAVVRVRDHGEGIAPELSEKIFAFQFTTKEQGNGLGLSSCRQIIEERHGGSLGFTSIPGEETTFTFTLPMG